MKQLIAADVGSVVQPKELGEICGTSGDKGDGRGGNGSAPSHNMDAASSSQLTASHDSDELWFVLTVGL